jgi:hypothetical protein
MVDSVSRTLLLLLAFSSMVLAPACGGDDDGDGASPDAGVFDGELPPILFATQVPVGENDSVSAVFSNHVGGIRNAPRGGDLMIRYPDGTLRNLTREAGFGDADEMQRRDAISVREPCVHWDGDKALFSMAVGAVTERFEQRDDFRWQIYEVTGLAQGETAAVRRVEGQPRDFNNVSPVYGSDDRIIFISDRPRNGADHLYPQLDEYESQPTTTGVYRLDEASGDLEVIEHAPSGVFSLTVDSFGRVIFSKWDHLQRDQQADSADTAAEYGPITFDDESPGAASAPGGEEVFPEPRDQDDPAFDPAVSAHRFNQFFPWEMNQDGSAEETLNHVGRQEWGGSFSEGSFTGDDNLSFEAPDVFRDTREQLQGDGGVFHIRQDPTDPAWYLGTLADEFGTGSGGTLIRFEGDPTINPEDMHIEALTPTNDDAEIPEDTGYFRNPLRVTGGALVAVHTAASGQLGNTGSDRAPEYNYDYRLTVLTADGDTFRADSLVTTGIERTVSWFTPDEVATWSGNLWELDPVEVVARERPPLRTVPLPDVEMAVFADAGVSPDDLSTWLRERELALVISRNVTQRDRNDVQQPYNLAVPGGVESVATGGTVYDIDHIQFFQGDQLRGYDSYSNGRRILARPMHGPDLVTDGAGPAGSVALGTDGSMAAFVPARRAMTWQLVAPDDSPVVRERNWISFQAGEIRVCAACHGINKRSQTGDPLPTNSPEALRDLLEAWKASQ